MINEIITKVKNWYENGGNFGESCPQLTIEASDNSIKITINRNYLKAEAFRDFIRDLDDDLFLEVCEELGNSNIVNISNSLETGDSLEENIKLFKDTLIEIISEKYKYYKECLEKYTGN